MSSILLPDDPRLTYFNSEGRSADGAGLLLSRIPETAMSGWEEQMANLARMAAGVEVRLRTDAAELTVQLSADTTKPEVTSYVQAVVADGAGGEQILESPLACSGQVESHTFKLSPKAAGAQARRPRDWRLLFSYRSHVRLAEIVLPAGAAVGGPGPRPAPRVRLLCYGDSITQGASATRPSRSYVFQLASRLGVEALNLGFSGKGFARSQETAYFLSRDDWGAMTIAVGTNSAGQAVSKADVLAADYRAMLRTIRSARPDAPIVCLSPLWRGLDDEPKGNAVGEPMQAYRDAVESAVRDAIAAGDRKLFLVEGLAVIGGDGRDLLPDALHPADAGMTRMADCLEPVLRRALGM
ncbi:MAG: hypothetical protein BIFFINMI_02953 [Phycisphaerae bacterium]|nr:hypothetical protein [Phycisphaerae bacterium]